MISLNTCLVLAAILFAIGFAGIVINRKNMIVTLMSLELMLLAVNTNFVAFSQYGAALVGQVYVFFVLAVAAAEAAVGLAIVVLFYRQRASIQIDDMSRLKG